ncbi:MAG: putative nucleotidyltransferase [Cryomorphaceae bacterium]|jgi:predicted nucleotidyltransferase
MNEHIKVLTNSSIVINRIVQLLEENNIQSLVKDNVESSKLAGFGTSYFDVDLYVYKSDVEKAQEIIKGALEEK